jgi:hypothetical protein
MSCLHSASRKEARLSSSRYDASKGFLERLLSSLDVLSQDLIDEDLVTATAGTLEVVLEPRKHFIIETDSDARFTLWN